MSDLTARLKAVQAVQEQEVKNDLEYLTLADLENEVVSFGEAHLGQTYTQAWSDQEWVKFMTARYQKSTKAGEDDGVYETEMSETWTMNAPTEQQETIHALQARMLNMEDALQRVIHHLENVNQMNARAFRFGYQQGDLETAQGKQSELPSLEMFQQGSDIAMQPDTTVSPFPPEAADQSIEHQDHAALQMQGAHPGLIQAAQELACPICKSQEPPKTARPESHSSDPGAIDEDDPDLTAVNLICTDAPGALQVRLSDLTPAERAQFEVAKETEVQNWIKTGTISKVLRDQIPDSQIMKCRWILTWKETDPAPDTPSQAKGRKAKARVVILGFMDPSLDSIPRDSPTLGRTSKMVALQLVSSHKWLLQSFDVKAAFLQGKPKTIG
ncbi:unnamed protein product [Cladocopium goreaui]|uniref:Retrovirus-related Pol polyprotein from transposon TNT 1-94 n=1 Tax=Cladocopium goreaui TaxID=2562237 RepID=A0A9P1C8N5_9DINO|nr:unnamed protein product [Cladocopium goreaui]